MDFCATRLRKIRGFTLIELIMVIVLMGVLSVFVAPTLFNSNDFNARGFHDQTLAFLRYAQKSAIAQRRTVCVSFSLNRLSLTMDADGITLTGSNGCEATLTAPSGGTLNARGAAQYSSLPSVIVFSALGQPGAGQTIQVSGVTKQIVIEAVTGYVHE